MSTRKISKGLDTPVWLPVQLLAKLNALSYPELVGRAAQKSTRAFIVTVLDPVAPVMRPKEAELISVLGLPHCGVFRMLIMSARIVKLVPSVIWTRLLSAASRPRLPGPRIPDKFTAVFPVVPGAGFCRRMLPALSTTTWLVKRPARLVSVPKSGRGAARVLRPSKYSTKPSRTWTFPKSEGRIPTRSAVLILARLANVLRVDVKVRGEPEVQLKMLETCQPSTIL